VENVYINLHQTYSSALLHFGLSFLDTL